MKNFKTGDIFVFPLPTGEWMCGRIMFDIKNQCIHPKLLDQNSPLLSLPKSLLVEVYQLVSPSPEVKEDHITFTDVLIPGIFISTGCFENERWRIIGYREVDPTNVEFPETLINKGPKGYFVRGEVELPIEISFKKIREISCYKTEYPCGILGEIALCQLGQSDAIKKPEATINLSNLSRSDLRFSPYRNGIYEQLNESTDQSYDQMAKRKGFDLGRFYQ